jgi:deoxyadenosine/deoxycytidine kinase
MLAIMFDPRFKNMKVIWDFVSDSFALQVVVEYDAKIMYSLLVQTYFHLNPMKAIAKLIVVEDDDNFFGQTIYNNDVIMSIMRNELHLFCWLSVGPMEIKNPLQW